MLSGRSLIVLTGGQSKRMGQDKAVLPTPTGERILDRLVRRLGREVDGVIIAGPHECPGAGVQMQRVDDFIVGAGPLAGMYSGFKVSGAPIAWVVACDFPDVEPALGKLLFRELGDHDAVVPRIDGQPQGLCAVYRISIAERIPPLLSTGDRSVRSLLDTCRVRYLTEDELRRVDPDLASFVNLNSPAGYAAWLRQAAAPTQPAPRSESDS